MEIVKKGYICAQDDMATPSPAEAGYESLWNSHINCKAMAAYMLYGDITKMVRKCTQQFLEPITPLKTSIFLKIIQKCQGDSRE
jgi:hypothetical protein